MKTYRDFVDALAPFLGNGFISQDELGTDFTCNEPNLQRGVGANRHKHVWTTPQGSNNIVSALFKNIPIHNDSTQTLYQIIDGKAHRID